MRPIIKKIKKYATNKKADNPSTGTDMVDADKRVGNSSIGTNMSKADTNKGVDYPNLGINIANRDKKANNIDTNIA